MNKLKMCIKTGGWIHHTILTGKRKDTADDSLSIRREPAHSTGQQTESWTAEQRELNILIRREKEQE